MLFRSMGGNIDPVDGLLSPSAPPQLAVGELIGRFEPDTKRLYVACSALRDWCSARRLPYAPFTHDLKVRGVLLNNVQCQLGKGTKLPGGAVRAHCFDSEGLGLDAAHLVEH